MMVGYLSGLEGPILLAWIFLSCSHRRKKGTLSRIINSLFTKIVGHAGWTLEISEGVIGRGG